MSAYSMFITGALILDVNFI